MLSLLYDVGKMCCTCMKCVPSLWRLV